MEKFLRILTSENFVIIAFAIMLVSLIFLKG